MAMKDTLKLTFKPTFIRTGTRTPKPTHMHASTHSLAHASVSETASGDGLMVELVPESSTGEVDWQVWRCVFCSEPITILACFKDAATAPTEFCHVDDVYATFAGSVIFSRRGSVLDL
eukprot:2054082-Pleurochrysis_carterae.AAC.1